MRQYNSIAHLGAPFRGAYYLHGLGADDAPREWPATKRSYWSTAYFRAPYKNGYFQDNTLMGTSDDVKTVLRQVPTWAYVLGGLGLGYLAFRTYKQGKKNGDK